MPPYPSEGLVVVGSAMLGLRTNPNGTGTPNPVVASSEVAGSKMRRSTLILLTAKSGATGFSSTYFWVFGWEYMHMVVGHHVQKCIEDNVVF